MTYKKSDSVADVVAGPTGTFPLEPKRVALLTRDWFEDNDAFDEECGLTPHLPKALRAADDAGCDLVVCSLWSRLHRGSPIKRTSLFPKETSYSAILFADADVTKKRWVERVHVFNRHDGPGAVLTQRFGSSKDAVGRKRAFMADLPSRLFGSSLVMLCGESNIVRTKRATGAFVDDEGFLQSPEFSATRLILNPGHTFMRRYEMPLKRLRYSQGGRCCITVWNRGNPKNGNEARTPWAVYFDGRDATNSVAEIKQPVKGASGIRLGIVELSRL